MKSFNRSFGLQWHVTDQCDQRCKHCYIWSNVKKISNTNPNTNRELNLQQCIQVVDNFLEFCKEFKVNPFICITGGDPLLFQWIWELLEYINQKKVPFIILGNPFHINKSICEKLFNLGCKSYQLSLDGLESTHDYLRKDGSFKSTFIAIKELKKTNIRIAIMSTVSRLNYHEIPELVKIVVKNEIDIFSFARYCPTTTDNIDYQLSPNEYKNFLSQMWQVYTDLSTHKTKFTLKDHLWKAWLYEQCLFKIRQENLVFQGCGCGIRHLTLLSNGIVYACRRFESPIGNVFSQSFQQIFLSQELNQYRKIEKLMGCKDCELLNYCRGCHAVSYGVFGDFFARDPQCWWRRDEKN